MFRFKDDCGYWWTWDGSRIYLEDAEEEMGDENGYPASTLEEAIRRLIWATAITTIEIG